MKRQLQLSGQAINDDGFDGHEAQHDQGHQPGRFKQHTHINTHADRDEEQPQQQTFKGFDIGFEFTPVLTLGQQNPSQKGTQSHGKAHPLHQSRDAHHEQ